MLLARVWPVCQCSMFTVNVYVQVDTMEMMRHPEETTNMRRQTVASYFRVGVFPVVLLSHNKQQLKSIKSKTYSGRL